MDGQMDASTQQKQNTSSNTTYSVGIKEHLARYNKIIMIL